MAEVTNEELLKQIDELTKKFASHDEVLLAHEGKFEAQGKFNEKVDKALSGHEGKFEAQEKVNKNVGAALKKIATAEVKAEVAPAKKNEKLTTPTVKLEVDGEKYVFTGPKMQDLQGNQLLTATVAESPEDYKELLAHLVTKGSHILKKVVS